MTMQHKDPRQPSDLDPDPLVEFRLWFDAAQASGIAKPDAMMLATATRDGMPSARIVFLRGFDAQGLVFYTNYESRKGRELEENPMAALVLHWDPLSRQVRMEGHVEKLTHDESARYFYHRPFDSRLAAWASSQSRVIASRQVLDDRMAALRAQHRDGEVPLPPFWGGYRVVPQRIEFWLSRPYRLHDRFCYSRQATGGWEVVQLAP